MNAVSAYKKHKEIIALCQQRRLKEALHKLQDFVSLSQCEDGAELEGLKTSFSYLLDYFGKVDDPERGKVFSKLIEKTALLADKVNRFVQIETSEEVWFEQERSFENEENINFSTILFKLNTCFETLEQLSGDCVYGESYRELRESYEESLGDLFDFLRFASEDKLGGVEIFRDDKPFAWRYLSVSACLLGLLHDFSRNRILLLIYYSGSEDKGIRNISYTALLFAMMLYRERVHLSFELTERMKIVFSNADFQRCYTTIQLVSLQSRETEKLKKTLQEDVLPDMMKKGEEYLKEGDLNVNPLLEEDIKPEWGELEDSMKQLGELHKEGADVNIVAFDMQKNNPFFKWVYTWFLPFDVHSSLFMSFRKGSEEIFDELVGFFGDIPEMCNTDRYANTFTMLAGIKGAQGMVIKRMLSEAKETFRDRALAKALLSAEETKITPFIHDLYRFLKSYKPSILKNVFEGTLDMYNIPEVREVISEKTLMEIAGKLMRYDHYSEAFSLLNSINIKDEELLGEFHQRKGYCLQKLEKIREAIGEYENAELYTPDNKWLIQQLALCHKRLKNFKESLRYYLLLEEKSVQKEPIIFAIGLLYIELSQYEKALNRFYKLQFLGWDKTSNLDRAIAWVLFLMKRYEQSKGIYIKLIKAEKKVEEKLERELMQVTENTEKSIAEIMHYKIEGDE